jgi:hypothetical protein
MGVDESKRDAWYEMQSRNMRVDLEQPQLPLKGGGGGGTSGGMNVSMKDYIDARDAAVASDMHTEFANLRADIAKLPTTWTLVGTALAIVSILVAVLAFGGARFSAGISLADQRETQLQRDSQQDAVAKATASKLDEILKRLPKEQSTR